MQHVEINQPNGCSTWGHLVARAPSGGSPCASWVATTPSGYPSTAEYLVWSQSMELLQFRAKSGRSSDTVIFHMRGPCERGVYNVVLCLNVEFGR